MSESDPYSSAIAELEALARQPVLPARQVGLSRAERLLAELGDPQREFRTVHVTGSSGKGSTTTMIGAILESAGFEVGYLRSPHLVSYTERIALSAEPIAPPEWADYWSRLRPLVDAMESGALPNYSLGRPTFSEVIFALAALYFRDRGTDWAVLEAGLGGRYDATNVVASETAVITTVSLEHTQMLGNTLAAIAAEKAAIIKPGSAAATGATSAEALSVIEARAAEVGAPLLRVPTDVPYEIEASTLLGTSMIAVLENRPIDVHLRLAGSFQAKNAAVAVAAVALLRRRGIAVDDYAIVGGLSRASIPGRLEVICREPLVILDGAHHPAAIGALRADLSHLLAHERVVLLFTALSDKNVSAMAGQLRGFAGTIVLTSAPGTPRAMAPETLANHFHGSKAQLLLEDDPEAALDMALEMTGRDGALVVCGSLYLVGYVREILLRSRVPS